MARLCWTLVYTYASLLLWRARCSQSLVHSSYGVMRGRLSHDENVLLETSSDAVLVKQKGHAAIRMSHSAHQYRRDSSKNSESSSEGQKMEHLTTYSVQKVQNVELVESRAKDVVIGVSIGGGVLVCCLFCCCCCGLFRSELSKNLREPGEGWIGRLAISMMDNEGNKLSSEDMVQRAGVSSGQTVVELGPGNGHFLLKAPEQGCKKIYGVEVSAAFRAHLERTLAGLEPEPEIRGDDAKSMKFLEDNSVDCILGMNVIYFLEPLSEYLAEFNRVLKPGGTLFWGCKFEAAKMQDSSVAKNSAEELVVEAMKMAGFQVRTEKADFGGTSKGDYLAIIGLKTSAGTDLVASNIVPADDETSALR